MPDLAVIIPTLNEARQLPRLLTLLNRQTGLRLKIIVADGGSSDGTPIQAQTAGVILVRSAAGRGRQMNAGAQRASTAYLLFLHADSYCEAPDTLAQALAALKHAQQNASQERIAGHFPLRFDRSDPAAHRFGYRYMEEKSALNRPYCQNGDQGLLLSSGYFRELGGFDESLPFFEDLRMAERIHATGRWITLPGVLHSSARRLEQEGWLARYRLMGLMVAAHGMSLQQFFQRAPQLYQQHNHSGRLLLSPYLRLFREIAHELGGRATWEHLLRLGHFSRRHWWQLFFLADVALRRWLGPDRYPTLKFYDRVIYPITANRLGDVITAVLAWLYGMGWLRLSFAFRERRLLNHDVHKEKIPPPPAGGGEGEG
ncbi:MAG: glycosyltransferase [Nevskiales bacterium]